MGSDSWPWMVGLSKSEPLPTRNRQSSAVEADKPSGSFCSPPNPPRPRRHRQPCDRRPVRRVSLHVAVFPSIVLPAAAAAAVAATTTTAAATATTATIAHKPKHQTVHAPARPPRLLQSQACEPREPLAHGLAAGRLLS